MPLLTTLTFAELTNQVHLINDMILSDMICENQNHSSGEAINFSRHLLSTKHWFARISWSNKKRYLLALLDDVRSAWTLSLILKSMWNCRPKDAVLSANEPEVWSSYDQVPVDHNRTAQPVPTLAQVMKNDRVWFLDLDPDLQALVLTELLTVAGGPVMWEVIRRAEAAFQRYRDEQLRDLQECSVLEQPITAPSPQVAAEKSKKESPQVQRRKSSAGNSPAPDGMKPPPPPGQAQKELDMNLAIWNATIKSLRDSVKLEELEMTFNDGTKKKIWKVNRPRPEVVETVDFVQLLPSAVGKRIISYLPRAQLGDYARVNKYWAYLVDDFRAELAARLKINTDLDKLQELMLRHDTSSDMLAQLEFRNVPSSQGAYSAAPSRMRPFQPSVRASERSAGAISFRHMLDGRLAKPAVAPKPLRKLAELTDRLERRGAADENIWLWCQNINKQVKRAEKQKVTDYQEGLLPLGNMHFPCPLMKLKMDVPLKAPLCKDPAVVKSLKPRRDISNAAVLNVPKHSTNTKKYSLWTKDFSKLYPVFKIPSHQSPV